jgi:predicted alpha/beta superfamily hydrolase
MKPRMTRAAPAFVSHSRETATDYRIYVSAPDPRRSRGPWPSVVLMDGDFFFDTAVQATHALVRSGKIPPTAVIGVGYGASFGKPGNYRGRDYTPARSPLEPLSGGADRFLGYVTGPLWRELRERYPLARKGRVIAGHSVGSLFVLYALFQRRPFFDGALASAPSIWWANRAILKTAASLRKGKAALPARLYLGVGEDDSPSMLGDLGLLLRQLEARPFRGLKVNFEQFPKRDHYNVLPDTLRAGLATLLG